jgi:hypothetical protein
MTAAPPRATRAGHAGRSCGPTTNSDMSGRHSETVALHPGVPLAEAAGARQRYSIGPRRGKDRHQARAGCLRMYVPTGQCLRRPGQSGNAVALLNRPRLQGGLRGVQDGNPGWHRGGWDRRSYRSVVAAAPRFRCACVRAGLDARRGRGRGAGQPERVTRAARAGAVWGIGADGREAAGVPPAQVG